MQCANSNPAANIVDWAEAVVSERGLRCHVRVPRAPAQVDLWLVRHENPGETAADRAMPFSVEDARVARAGQALEDGRPDPIGNRSIARGPWVVNFGDPNTTKPLHVGHLRNLAVGQAIAGMAEAAGADVFRQSRVGDYGRNMGEALAGYLTLADGVDPVAVDEKADHLIGREYVSYVRSVAAATTSCEVDSVNAPLAREGRDNDDLAERILHRIATGEAEALDLFHRVRGWVVEAQDMTLARLGIVMDRTLFEADYLEAATELVADCLEAGIVERARSGAVLYPTGDGEYSLLLLARSDGFPTQHLRYISTWRVTQREFQGASSVAVLGSEWGPLSKYCAQILVKLGDGCEVHPLKTVTHGMVVSEGAVIKSSAGAAFLVDGMLDELIGCDSMECLPSRHARICPDEVAAIVALAYFLMRPVKQRIAMSPDALIDPSANPAWTIAHALLEAWRPEFDGKSDPEPADRDYRFLVIRAHLMRRLLAHSLDRLDATTIARYAYHLSTWFLSARRSSRASRVMRTVLGEALLALGLRPRVYGSGVSETGRRRVG
jgi:arginyl-tRNA synthetase